MATLKNRWRVQIWVIQKWFPSVMGDSFHCLNSGWKPKSEGFTQIWVIRCSLWWNDYHSKLGDNCTDPSDLSDALKTEGNQNTAQRKHQSPASLTFVIEGNSPVTGEIPTQSSSENVSIWWRHHELTRRGRVSLMCTSKLSFHCFRFEPTLC